MRPRQAIDLRRPARAALVLALSVPAISAVLMPELQVVDPAARAAVETAIVFAALASVVLLHSSLERGHESADVLIFCAVLALTLTDLIYYAAPALESTVKMQSRAGPDVGVAFVIALTFLLAATAPSRPLARPGRSAAICAAAVGALSVTLGTSAGRLVTPASIGLVSSSGSRAGVIVQVLTAAILVEAGVAFLIRSTRSGTACALLAGACLIMACVTIRSLVTPVVATDWLTTQDGLRLAAYVLLLGAAYARYAQNQQRTVAGVRSSERERLARELHDGLAQDLACIAAESQRLGSTVGPEHPLLIATRRALAASRGAIVDLYASTAASTDEALQLVAHDLEGRLDIDVDVRVATDPALAGGRELDSRDREKVVRIAREATVNAALHGGAHHVEIALVSHGSDLLLRVSDDGSGIDDSMRPGFGWRAMRSCAEALGGQLSTHRRADGGTDLELVVR